MTSAHTANQIRDALAIAERQWRAMHIVDHERAALAEDLHTELTGAVADGISPRQLLGDDIREFARNLAVEAGVTRIPYENRRLLRTAAGGAAPGVVLGWLSMFGGLWLPGAPFSYPVLALTVLVGALVAVRVRMAEVPQINRTVAAMALLVSLAGILVTPVIMGFASLFGYSTAWVVVLMEMAIAAAAVGGATLMARRWAMAPWVAAAARMPSHV